MINCDWPQKTASNIAYEYWWTEAIDLVQGPSANRFESFERLTAV